MTLQEVINQLDLAIVSEKYLIKCSTMAVPCHRNQIEALEIAKSIIEKQIPQKAIIEREDFPEINSFCETYRCPICKKELITKDRVGFDGDLNKYCDCGQAIDYQF